MKCGDENKYAGRVLNIDFSAEVEQDGIELKLFLWPRKPDKLFREWTDKDAWYNVTDVLSVLQDPVVQKITSTRNGFKFVELDSYLIVTDSD